MRLRAQTHCFRTHTRSIWCAARSTVRGVSGSTDASAAQVAGDASVEPIVCDTEAVVARAFDAALLNAVQAEDVRQGVVLGHGGDTRAYRLPWPTGVRVFELAPFDAVAHAELAFARVGVRAAKGVLLRRIAADVSTTHAAGTGWTQPLLSAGFMADRTSTWALQGLHLLQPGALTALLLEVGDVAAVGSTLTGEVRLHDAERSLGALLASAGFQLEAWAPVQEVAAGLGRAVGACEPPRALFSATKTRVTGRQHDEMRAELQRAEGEAGEEGFADDP